jgi:hypothetical protein
MMCFVFALRRIVCPIPAKIAARVPGGFLASLSIDSKLYVVYSLVRCHEAIQLIEIGIVVSTKKPVLCSLR